jgi:hypothetical protein
VATSLASQTTDSLEIFAVLLVAPVRKIEPSNVEAGLDELAKNRLIGRSRPKSPDDLAMPYTTLGGDLKIPETRYRRKRRFGRYAAVCH